jgi:hypothetical protein
MMRKPMWCTGPSKRLSSFVDAGTMDQASLAGCRGYVSVLCMAYGGVSIRCALRKAIVAVQKRLGTVNVKSRCLAMGDDC